MSRRKRSEDNPISLFSFQDIVTSVSGIMIFIVLLLATDLTNQEPVPVPADATAVDPAQMQQMHDELEELLQEIAQLREEILRQGDKLRDTNRIDLADIENKTKAAKDRAAQLAQEIADLDQALKEWTTSGTDSSAETAKAEEEIVRLQVEVNRLRRLLEDETLRNRLALIPDASDGKRPILVQIGESELKAKVLRSSEEMVNFPGGVASFTRWMRGRKKELEYFVLLVKPSGTDRFPEVLVAVTDAGFDAGFEPLEENMNGVY